MGLLRNIAQNNRIVDVETTDDPIVYSGGITHTDFVSDLVLNSIVLNANNNFPRLCGQAAALKGRVVKDVGRYGSSLNHIYI